MRLSLAALYFLCLPSCEKDKSTDPTTPFIESAELQNGKLLISGNFGDTTNMTERVVYINDQPLATQRITSWTENTIICLMEDPIPEEINIVVEINKKKSNKKVLRNESTYKIDYLLVDEEHDLLQIWGKFPNEKGTVTIDKELKVIKEWSSGLIICQLQFYAPAYGDVIVQSGNQKTPPRTLYEWLVEYQYTRPHGGLDGEIEEELSGSISIRGDINPAPAYVVTNAAAFEALSYFVGPCLYTVGGTTHSEYDCHRMTAAYQNVSLHLDLGLSEGNPVGHTHYFGHKEILPNGFDLYLDFEAWEEIPTKVTDTDICNGGSVVTEKKWSSQLLGFSGYDAIPLRFDPGTHNIKSEAIFQEVYNSTQLLWDFADGDLYKRMSTLVWTSKVYPN